MIEFGPIGKYFGVMRTAFVVAGMVLIDILMEDMLRLYDCKVRSNQGTQLGCDTDDNFHKGFIGKFSNSKKFEM